MKKTLTIILAIVLVLSVCFACIACDGNTPTGGNTDDGTGGKTDDDNNGGGEVDPPVTDLTENEAQIKNIMDSYASAWLINNASDEDLSKGLNSALNTLRKGYSQILKSVKVSKTNGQYKIDYGFEKATASTLVDAPAVNEGVYAGETMGTIDAKPDSDVALGAIINGVFKSIKLAVESGQSFGDNGIGFDATAYFDFYYGDMDAKLNYGLRVAGQIGFEAKDTFAGIEVVDGSDVIGGLYYEGAADKNECKLYLNAGEYKYYIDNSDLNAIVMSVIDIIQGIVTPDPTPDVNAALEDPFYNTEVTKLSDILPSDIASIAGPMLSGIITEVSTTKVSAGTKYQVRIDLDSLLGEILGAIPGLSQIIDLKSLPAPLNQLDLGKFQGVGGALLVTGVVKTDGSLNDLELSYNCARKDFRFNAEDVEAKIYGPINVAFGIKDFEIGAQQKDHVLPADRGTYSYFSPLNVDLTVVVTVNNDSYSAHIVSDVNPFAIENGVITFVVSKNDASWMNGRITTANGDVVVKLGDDMYIFTAEEFAMSAYKAGAMVVNAVINTDTTIFAPIVGYVKDLITMFNPGDEGTTDGDATTQADPTIDETTEGGFSIKDIMSAMGIIDEAKALLATWQEEKILDYNFSGETLADDYFELKVGTAQYNQVLDLVKKYFTFIDLGDFTFTDTAANVYVNYNKGDYKDMVYVSVEYKEVTVLVTVDGSKWNDEGLFTVTVNVNDVIYEAKLDCANWDENGVAHVTYVANGVTYVDVTVDTKAGTLDATLLANGHTYHYVATLQLGETSIRLTLNLDGISIVVYGSDPYFTQSETKTSFGLPTFETGVSYGWSIPNNTSDVSVKITLNSWGESVTVEDNEAILSGDKTAEIGDLLTKVANEIISAIQVNKTAE